MHVLLILIVWLVLSVAVSLIFGAIAGGADRLRADTRQGDRSRPKVRFQTATGARRIVIPFRTDRAA